MTESVLPLLLLALSLITELMAWNRLLGLLDEWELGWSLLGGLRLGLKALKSSGRLVPLIALLNSRSSCKESWISGYACHSVTSAKKQLMPKG